MSQHIVIADLNLQYLLWPGLLVFIAALLMFDIGSFLRFRYLKATLLLSLLLIVARLLALPWYSGSCIADHYRDIDSKWDFIATAGKSI
jgi:hypothetical protein